MKKLKNIVLITTFAISANVKANDCIISELGGSAELNEKCKEENILKVEEKSYEVSHVTYFSSVNYISSEQNTKEEISILDDAYVLLNWFPATVNTKNSTNINLQLEVIKDETDNQIRILLKRPDNLDTKHTLKNSPFFDEKMFNAFKTKFIAVPKSNVLYIDQSESFVLGCSTGYFGNSLDAMIASVPYLGSKFQTFEGHPSWSVIKPEYVEMKIRTLLNLDGSPALISKNGKPHRLASIEYGEVSTGPSIAGIDLDQLSELKNSGLCEKFEHTIRPRIKVQKPKQKEIKVEVLQQELTKNNRRGD